MIYSSRLNYFYLLFFTVLALLWGNALQAATPANTLIRAQATASYLVDGYMPGHATSNEVVTLVQPVTGVLLEQDQTRLIAKNKWANKTVVFPHVLTNTGNTPAYYQLSISKDSGSSSIYLDSNHNGQVNNTELIQKPLFISPGEKRYLLVETENAQKGSVIIRAEVDSKQCQFSSDDKKRCWDENIDTIKIWNHPIYDVTKTMDKQSAITGDEVLVTLHYDRMDSKGNSNSKLIVSDLLPEAMEIIDKNSIEECNTSGSLCNRLTEHKVLSSDGYTLGFNTENNRQIITIRLTKDKPAAQGYISFTAKIKPGYNGNTYLNKANYYSCQGNGQNTPGNGSCTDLQSSNQVPIEIIGPGVAFNGSTVSDHPDADDPVIINEDGTNKTYEFINYLWNTGTEQDSFNITLEKGISSKGIPFPDDTTFTLIDDVTKKEVPYTVKNGQADSKTLVIEKLEPGTYRKLIFRVTSNTDFKEESEKINQEDILKYFSQKLKATSIADSNIYDSVENRLIPTHHRGYGVDLTVLDENGERGKGQGPEAEAQKNIKAQANKPVQVRLKLHNTGDFPDTYQLGLQQTLNGSEPEHFSYRFLINGQPITKTPVIPIEGNYEVILEITADKDISAKPQSFYVTAHSTVDHNQKDTLHLAIQLDTTPRYGLLLEPNGEGQVVPGTFVLYQHRLVNQSSIELKDIKLETKDSQGWQSVIYLDVDKSGDLSQAGQPITKIEKELKPGDEIGLLVKVFAPANALQGTKNITTLIATPDTNITGIGPLQVFDTTTVNNTHVVIIKEQAADKGCTGTGDTKFSKNNFSASPGSCVLYRLTASNQGSEPVKSVIIHDAAPEFTQFNGIHDCDKGPVTGGEPSSYQISCSIQGQLNPGEAARLIFGIKIQ